MRVPAIFFPRNPGSRYTYLLLWLVGYLLASAVAEGAGGKQWLMDVLFLAVLMATIFGQFYTAVLVARLVGLIQLRSGAGGGAGRREP